MVGLIPEAFTRASVNVHTLTAAQCGSGARGPMEPVEALPKCPYIILNYESPATDTTGFREM